VSEALAVMQVWMAQSAPLVPREKMAMTAFQD